MLKITQELLHYTTAVFLSHYVLEYRYQVIFRAHKFVHSFTQQVFNEADLAYTGTIIEITDT